MQDPGKFKFATSIGRDGEIACEAMQYKLRVDYIGTSDYYRGQPSGWSLSFFQCLVSRAPLSAVTKSLS